MESDSKRIIIVGAGGQGAIVADILQQQRAQVIGFVDDTPSAHGTTVLGVPVLGPMAALRDIPHDAIIVAIGNNRLRRELTERLAGDGERLATAIHPFSYIAPSATIGEGSMISAGALVLPRAQIGRGVLLNTKSSVDHDSVVGDFAHVSAGATVGALAHIGDETLIAIGASVVTSMRVGSRATVAAGAVAVANVPDDVTVFGVPARVRSSS